LKGAPNHAEEASARRSSPLMRLPALRYRAYPMRMADRGRMPPPRSSTVEGDSIADGWSPSWVMGWTGMGSGAVTSLRAPTRRAWRALACWCLGPSWPLSAPPGTWCPGSRCTICLALCLPETITPRMGDEHTLEWASVTKCHPRTRWRSQGSRGAFDATTPPKGPQIPSAASFSFASAGWYRPVVLAPTHAGRQQTKMGCCLRPRPGAKGV
jgi:hypothetical protein